MKGRSKGSAGEKARVLVVDDEPDFLALVRSWLAPRYDFVGLSDGEELSAALEEFRPDLIILDVHMPGPDGFALCRRLRAQERFARIPVLFLTAAQDDLDLAQGLDAGATDYLTKPLSSSRLVSKIEETLL